MIHYTLRRVNDLIHANRTRIGQSHSIQVLHAHDFVEVFGSHAHNGCDEKKKKMSDSPM